MRSCDPMHGWAMPSTTTLVREHPSFPTALRDIPGWPKVLHCHGVLRPKASAIAIVGARAATKTARLAARELASELAVAGYSVISGGALGVDSAAHEGALLGLGHTVAVMACGLDKYYPRRNQRLFDAVLERGGAIVSPYELGCEPLPGRFVRRNQIIAALAELVIIVEASTNSGSLHTARFALRLGRKLAVIAGSPGCELLIAEGVPAIVTARDVAKLLSGSYAPPPTALPSSGSADAQVLDALSLTKALHAADFYAQIGQPLRTVQRSLQRLHLDLLVVALPGQRFRLSTLAATALAAKHLAAGTTP